MIATRARLLLVGVGVAVATQLVLVPVWWGVGRAAVLPIAAGLAHAGLVCAVASWTLGREHRPGPADLVTIVRAMTATGCLSLVVAGATGALTLPSWWLAALAVPTVLLDAVDGPVARRTRTATASGARFDMESDALLCLVLALAAALTHGWWLLALGLPRYVWAALCAALPRLRGPLPARPGRRVVAALQMCTLAAATIPAVPASVAVVALAIAGALVIGSFAIDARATMAT